MPNVWDRSCSSMGGEAPAHRFGTGIAVVPALRGHRTLAPCECSRRPPCRPAVRRAGAGPAASRTFPVAGPAGSSTAWSSGARSRICGGLPGCGSIAKPRLVRPRSRPPASVSRPRLPGLRHASALCFRQFTMMGGQRTLGTARKHGGHRLCRSIPQYAIRRTATDTIPLPDGTVDPLMGSGVPVRRGGISGASVCWSRCAAAATPDNIRSVR